MSDGLTLAEKIIAAHVAGGDGEARAGQIVVARVDLAIAQDPTAGIDAQQAALQRLTAQFPELAATAGIGPAAVAAGVDGVITDSYPDLVSFLEAGLSERGAESPATPQGVPGGR